MTWRPACCLTGVVLSACGLGGSDPLGETVANLGEIRSGVMELRVAAEGAEGASAGFELEGPFAIPEGDELPIAELEYTRFDADERESLTFLATGDSAFVEVDGQVYELPPAELESFRGTVDPGDAGPFDDLEIDDWVREPEVSEGETVDGVETQRIRGELDVVTALNDLLSLARHLGAPIELIEGDDAEQLRGATESATMEVLTGADDDLLRRLEISVDLQAEAPETLEGALDGLLGVGFELELGLDPNAEVDVTPPTDVRPYEDLVEAQT